MNIRLEFRTDLLLSFRVLPLALLVAVTFNLAAIGHPAQAQAASSIGQLAQNEEGEELTPEERRERARQIAEQRRKDREAQQGKDRAEAEAMYKEFSQAYLSNEFEKVQELYLKMRSMQRHLSRDQQLTIRHIDRMIPEYRPQWWKGTKKQEKNSFKAEIWGRSFWANYVPTRELGLQAVFPKTEINQKTGRLEVVDLVVLVTWKPLMIDSPDPAEGALAKMHGYKLGDIAEIIVWHELGHNYITEQVSTKANIELYNRYGDLYSTMHEYFADMSALYHCTPRARKIVLQFRLEELDYYTKDSSHCRAAHGIGAIVLTDMLLNPEKWPSVHFPPAVAENQEELNAIIYIYEHFPVEWTAEEDVRLQELAKEYVMKQGERTFKGKGEITLPNKLKYELMISEDNENQAKRNAWVRGKLEELIKSGRADKLAEGQTYEPPRRGKSRRRDVVRHVIVDGKLVREESGPPRIDVPWDH